MITPALAVESVLDSPQLSTSLFQTKLGKYKYKTQKCEKYKNKIKCKYKIQNTVGLTFPDKAWWQNS